MNHFPGGLRPLVLAAALAAALAGCSSPTGTSVTIQKIVVRSLPADFTTRKAVAYSGYRAATNADADAPTTANIDQDLVILKTAGYGLLRLFSSSDVHSKLVLQEIHALGFDNDLKVQLGVWISGPKATADAANQAEIARGIALAKAYPAIVEAVSVGNETMVGWGMGVPVLDMKAYIGQVRGAITQPVTTDDNWAFFANSNGATSGGPGTGSYGTGAILASIDYVSMHSYAFSDSHYNLFDWQQKGVSGTSGSGSTPSARATAMMNAAIADTKANYNAVKSYLSTQGYGSLPIMIGETGWKAVATNSAHTEEYDMAHPVNQKMYLDGLAAWTGGPANIVYFEAFDEPWKGGDDGWGLFDVNRHARYALYSSFAQTTTSGSVTIPANEGVLDGLAYTGSEALCYVPLVVNPKVTATKYLIYADTVTASTGVAVPSPTTMWFAWNNPATATGSEKSGTGSEGTLFYEVQPTPLVNNPAWGWGWFLSLTNASGTVADHAEDLSNFSAGHLHFAVKTTYSGKIRVGFSTGSSVESTGVDVYLVVDPSNNTYGYANDGAWHDVTIPIATISAKAAPAYQQPSTATLNLGEVTQPFVINDVYAGSNSTGNAVPTSGTTLPVIDLDNIYWTQN
jgi:exo-beta-1,3-glucanase (GH17 family)